MDTKEHLLTVLAEECCEVAQSVSKALRFGVSDGYPDKNTSNAQDIEIEFIEAMAVRDMLKEYGVLSDTNNEKEIYINKKKKVIKYMQYAIERGTLNEGVLNETK